MLDEKGKSAWGWQWAGLCLVEAFSSMMLRRRDLPTPTSYTTRYEGFS